MTSSASRLSLLALAIAAATPAAAVDLVISASNASQTSLNSAYGTVTINSGVTLGVDTAALYVSAPVGTLNNLGTLSASVFAIFQDTAGSIGTLNNSGTIFSDEDGIVIGNGNSMVINQLAGSISGDIYAIFDISNSSTLNWSGGTISGDVRGVKTLNLDLEHANLTRLQMPNASTIRMRLTTDNSQPVLKIDNGSGTFSLGSGSQILLRPSANNFAVNNQTYTLIQGESGSAPSLNVLSESPYLTVNSFTNTSSITANVSIAEAPQITQAGGTPNAQRAGTAITPLLPAMASSSPNDPVLEALAGSEAVQTTEELVPQVNGAVLQAANNLNDTAQELASQRTQALRGASAGDAFAERGVWLRALNSNVTQDERDAIEGYDADVSGLAIGADGQLNDQLTLGLSYNYLNSEATADGGNTTDTDGHAITLYSGFEQNAWFVDSGLTLGLNNNDSSRFIAGTEAKADYDSQLLGVNVVGGYGFQLDQGVLLEPRTAARYARVDVDSYREKGSIASLDVDSQRYEAIQLGAGLRLASDLPMGSGRLQPQATLMAYHDFAADQVKNTVTYTFGNSPFFAEGASATRTSYEANVGVDYTVDTTTIGLSYDYSGRDDFHADTLQAKVRYDF